MVNKLFISLLFFTGIWGFVESQNLTLTDVPAAFEKLGKKIDILTCNNHEFPIPSGGHIQGIQYAVLADKSYFLLSGSSKKFSYLALVALEKEGNSVSKLFPLLPGPLDHAGGFQWVNGILAVGIEDNFSKDNSTVNIYQLSNPEAQKLPLVKQTIRKGIPKRSTAGATALHKDRNGYMVAVADWDAYILDFYRFVSLEKELNSIRKTGSINLRNCDKTGWANPNFRTGAYQTINFIANENGLLFLAGFYVKKGRNLIDLFEVREHFTGESSGNSYSLKRIMRKTVICKKGTSFRYGSGLVVEPGGKLAVLASSPHLSGNFTICIIR